MEDDNDKSRVWYDHMRTGPAEFERVDSCVCTLGKALTRLDRHIHDGADPEEKDDW